MKRITVILICIFFFCLQNVNAQQNHFIYIQTENKQPFYIKLDKKILNSSVSGYLIIPRLREGVYNMLVGFPKNEWPEQNLVCQVDNKDIGYLLKNFGDKGWGFFNLQSMEIVMPAKNSNNTNASGEIKADAFSTMLSTVVNDPSIKQIEQIKDEPKTTQTGTNEKVKSTLPVAKSIIIKIYVNKKADGDEIVYTDIENGKEDTVRIFISDDKAQTSVISKDMPKEESPTVKDENQVVVNVKPDAEKPKGHQEKPKDEKFLSIELPITDTKLEGKQQEKQDTEIKIENKEATGTEKVDATQTGAVVKKPIIANSDCKSLASDEDFLKLRKKMASENSGDAMLSDARKSFKSKCFTTEQIKNLAVLFLKDLEKYNFFDLAYAYVSDSQNYFSLEALLTDSYYISRFKAMIRH